MPLTVFGEREFDNLVLLAQPGSEGADKRKGTVTVADVMGFIEDGGGLVVFLVVLLGVVVVLVRMALVLVSVMLVVLVVVLVVLMVLMV